MSRFLIFALCFFMQNNLQAAMKKNPIKRTTKREYKMINAARDGKLEKVQEAIKSKLNINAQDDYGVTALIGATLHDHIDIVNELIKTGADLDKQDINGWTALMYAIQFGKPNAIKALINAGAGLNLRSADGRTALMYAAEKNDKDIVSRLLKANADATIKNEKNENKTAAEYASFKTRAPIQRAINERLKPLIAKEVQRQKEFYADVANTIAEYALEPVI